LVAASLSGVCRNTQGARCDCCMYTYAVLSGCLAAETLLTQCLGSICSSYQVCYMQRAMCNTCQLRACTTHQPGMCFDRPALHMQGPGCHAGCCWRLGATAQQPATAAAHLRQQDLPLHGRHQRCATNWGCVQHTCLGKHPGSDSRPAPEDGDHGSWINILQCCEPSRSCVKKSCLLLGAVEQTTCCLSRQI
jgi:hypothetical protein